MTAHALMYVDKATFLRFVANSDERFRYEWVNGWIMQQQAGGTRKHGELGVAFCSILRQLLDMCTWAVNGPDRLTNTGRNVRFADAVVERRETAADESIETDRPVLLVEVLSPSSEERDLSIKSAEYLKIATLDTYIVASQDDVLCYVWQRRPDGTFDEATQRIEGRDRVVQVPGLGIAIPLAEVYRGIAI